MRTLNVGSIIYDPTCTAERVDGINRFQRIRAAQLLYQSSDIDELLRPILDLHRHSLCGNMDDVCESSLSWWFQLVQYPQDKHSIGQCCVGKPGVGKDTFDEVFGQKKLFEKYSMILTSSADEAIVNAPRWKIVYCAY